MTKWYLIFTFPLSGSTEEAPSRVVAIMPHVESDPSRGLPRWFFDPYTAPLSREDGSIVESEWIYDSLEFSPSGDGYFLEWIPQMGPAPCWTTQMSSTWDPLRLENWSDILLRLAAWQRRVYGGI